MRARSSSLLAYALGLAACTSTTYGEGIGRPTYPPKTPVERLPLSIVEAYVVDAAPANRFAIVTNAGSDPAVDPDGGAPLVLRSPVGDVSLGEAVPAAAGGVPGELRVSLASLAQPGPTLLGGELAVVDAAGTVHAYLAWTSDPVATGSDLAAGAYRLGASAPGTFVAGGFPVPPDLAFVATSGGSGCAAPSGTAAGITAVSACPVGSGLLAIHAFLPGSAADPTSWVLVENTSAEALDLLGVRLCQGDGCAVIPSDNLVGAGQRARIYLGAGPAAPAAGDVVVADAGPLAASDELALRAPGSSSADANPMLESYVRHGARDGRYVEAAVAAGLWPSADANALPPRIAGEIETLAADAALGAVRFVPAANDADVDSLSIGPTTDLWTTCSYARPWRASPAHDLFLTAIQRATAADAASLHGDLLVFTNRGSSAVALAGLTLDVTPGGTIDLGALGTSVDPGATLTVELKSPAFDCSQQPCVTTLVLGSPSEIVLRSAGAAVQYLAVGTGGHPSTGEVVTSNAWPGATYTTGGAERTLDCAVPAIGDSLTLGAALPGTSPADWN